MPLQSPYDLQPGMTTCTCQKTSVFSKMEKECQTDDALTSLASETSSVHDKKGVRSSFEDKLSESQLSSSSSSGYPQVRIEYQEDQDKVGYLFDEKLFG